MNEIVVIKTEEELRVSSFERGEIHRVNIHLSDNALGVPWKIPLVIIRGAERGPTLGITAALHGDELNGISTIFKLIEEVDPKKLKGTLVLVPISNVPGYLMNQRYFSDNVDLNRIMPGKAEGVTSNLYAHQFTSKIISKFNYLLDLHTASHGRVNSLYLRADIDTEETRTLAYLQNPQIIVKKFDENGTLRGWANDNGIPAITIEIGNSNAFQHSLIDETLDGVLNTMKFYEMIEGEVKDMVTNATVCDHSYWIYSKKGGIVDVLPELADKINAGEIIAKVYDVFGQVKEEVKADKSGVVIGKNVRPNCDAGTRILHLGVNIIEPETEDIPGHEDFEENDIEKSN
jgi:predicted deacylase